MSGVYSSMEDDNDADIFEQGFDEDFVPLAPDAYECPICLLVLNKPMQTVCGHRFCKGCILKVLREGRKSCPIDNEELDESQIYPDNFARREVLSLNVRCHNFQLYGCTWIGPLNKLKVHHEECEYAQVVCPNNCGMKVPRSELPQHQEYSCSRRIVSCKYCSIKVVHQRIQEHRERCNKLPVECPNGCDIGEIPREKLEHHMEYECPKSIVKCPYKDADCTFEGNRLDVDRHISENVEVHLRNVLTTFQSYKKSHEESLNDVQKTIEHRLSEVSSSPMNIDTLTSLKSYSGSMDKAEIEKLTKRVSDLDRKITQATAVTEMYRTEYTQTKSELQSKLDVLNKTVQEQGDLITEVAARAWCGKFIWKLTGFDELFKQAKSGKVPAVHSMPFYTSVPGYKMCLRVNLNGIDSGANTHISMFVHLMLGDYDSIMEWPFPGSITLTIMDQDDANEPQHIKETLTSRPYLQAFIRPKTNRNHKGYGYVEMMSHATLRTRKYVKDDAMMVRVDVRMPR